MNKHAEYKEGVTLGKHEGAFTITISPCKDKALFYLAKYKWKLDQFYLAKYPNGGDPEILITQTKKLNEEDEEDDKLLESEIDLQKVLHMKSATGEHPEMYIRYVANCCIR